MMNNHEFDKLTFSDHKKQNHLIRLKITGLFLSIKFAPCMIYQLNNPIPTVKPIDGNIHLWWSFYKTSQDEDKD